MRARHQTPAYGCQGIIQLAVSEGAAYYGMVRRGRGVRITGGSPRTYYVGVVPTGDAPEPGKITAVCVVPRGMEEGESVELETPEFKVLANQPVSFSLYSSNDRRGDQPGRRKTETAPRHAPSGRREARNRRSGPVVRR